MLQAILQSLGRPLKEGLAACFFLLLATGVSVANDTAKNEATHAFAAHCFSPFLTASKAQEAFSEDGVRFDFYDLDPFSAAPPSEVVGRAATAGTNRRCEVAFDGSHTTLAIAKVLDALSREGIDTPVSIPVAYKSTPQTALLEARQLNPKRIAVVEIGTRPGPNGVETFMRVERIAVPEKVTR